MPRAVLQNILLKFIEEDVGFGDITTENLIPLGIEAEAEIIAKENLVVAGIEEVKILFEIMGVQVTEAVKDGEEVKAGKIIMELKGDARDILTVERTALNLLMRMSGIATATRRLIEKIRKAGFRSRIAATRKTAPGLRYFDKKAILIGGGDTHRLRLDDVVLIKDNHIAIIGGIKKAIRLAKKSVSFSKKIEVEVRSSKEVLEAAKAGADIIMLDNMSIEEVKESMRLLNAENLRSNVIIEVSGGVTEENILNYAKMKPDVISIGYLTHSVKSVDISLEIKKIKKDAF
ncbi:TPA: carboxylating nicotinate-nucleotide diphosphorylase [Candidatus Bathyarchaeota archaeon]|nr:carboxylating nicotinate-nucleotide diphosphorylase [Candidatus Bathyarchaeota archaeon]